MNQPTIENLVAELIKLRERVDALERERAEEAPKRLALFSGDHAIREALLQFTQELVAREGFPVEHFVSRFHAAIDWHRDRFLRTVEGVDPQLAAQIDQRSLTDVPTDDLPPCMLPI